MAAFQDFRRVLITDKIDPVCKKVLDEHGIEVVMKPGLPKQDILKEIKVCECPPIHYICYETRKIVAIIARGKVDFVEYALRFILKALICSL